jgi:aspartyl-tRNA(Asn)/glutamyl-tRNA(Gln) amidotransferase subunit B
MRCDVNISLMEEGAIELGTKVEMKNINSFNNVEKAILYEIERQSDILKNGGTIIQETRRYSDEDDRTYSMREKVDAVDYKYFIEPNIPAFEITEELKEELKNEIPRLQYERINEYINNYNLSRYDATVLVKEKEISDYFEEVIKCDITPKSAANWVTGIILAHLNKEEINIDDLFLRPNMLADLIKLVESGKISIKQGKEVLYESLEEEKEPLKLVKEKNISQTSDEGEILKVVNEVLDEQASGVEEYKKGRTNVVDFMVGQVMKKTRGKANPSIAMKLIKQEIEKR